MNIRIQSKLKSKVIKKQIQKFHNRHGKKIIKRVETFLGTKPGQAILAVTTTLILKRLGIKFPQPPSR